MENRKNEASSNVTLRKSSISLIKRAIIFGKTYLALAIILSLIAAGLGFGVLRTLTHILGINNKIPVLGTGITLLKVTFGLQAVIVLATPVIILFVYDLNNGVLEYLISLGMNQRNIYMYYLRGAIFMTLLYSLVFAGINFIFDFILSWPENIITLSLVLLLFSMLSLSVVAFMITCMMMFSSLQKHRNGADQPLGLMVGGLVGEFPTLIFAILFTFRIAAMAEIFQSLVIILVFISLYSLSGKLIKREKFLP